MKTRNASRTAATLTSEPGPSKRPRKKLKVEETVVQDDFVADVNDTHAILPPPPAVTQRKPRGKGKAKETSIDTSTFLPRVSNAWKVGAHVSAAGGVENAVVNAAAIGANAFALFLKSQRKWTSPALQETSITLFKKRMKDLDYDPKHVLPHGSYLINLGNPDREKRIKSYECFLDDLKRCEALGLKYYNFQYVLLFFIRSFPGSTVGAATTEESIKLIAGCLNDAHKVTSSVVTVLENMAGAGNIIGSTFKDIADIIALVEDKTRVGVCFDTCHAYAAGYDISTKEGWDTTMTQFDAEIGLKYLCGMHINDSKTHLNSKKDRHENIGMGTLGLPAFTSILTDPRTQGIPLILETPSFEKPKEVWGVEISVLNRLSERAHGGVDVEEDGEEPGIEVKASHSQVDNEKLAEEVSVAVKTASKTTTKPKVVKGSSRKRKSGRDESDEDESECDG
ncbi:hypothetical protein H1R20_g9150, partial [Candolleomyces eurysporus]